MGPFWHDIHTLYHAVLCSPKQGDGPFFGKIGLIQSLIGLAQRMGPFMLRPLAPSGKGVPSRSDILMQLYCTGRGKSSPSDLHFALTRAGHRGKTGP
jgi:hypothetical protein